MKLAAGCSKHCFEVGMKTDEVSPKYCFEFVDRTVFEVVDKAEKQPKTLF
ncbi:chlorohydrolase [Streptococcus pneumoniae]|nr:chlorohydrolase [Streptococcus pneumoniae]